MKLHNIELKWLGHAGFFIKNSKTIYIDPYMIKEEMEKADILLITHSHYDHCSLDDLNKIVKEGTKIFVTADSQSKVTRCKFPVKIEVVEPGKEFDLGDLKIASVPAYNIDKHFHPKDEGWVGYVIKMGNVIIYHAGDTDIIPEMSKLTGFKQHGLDFVALLPVGGRFTMSAEEAAEAAKIIKPSLAIPMHWGSIIGSKDDAQEFKELCEEAGIRVEILVKE